MIEIRCDKMIEVKGVIKPCKRLLLEVNVIPLYIKTRCPKCKQWFEKYVDKK